MIGIVCIVQTESFEGAKVGFDGIEPTGISRRGNQAHIVVASEPCEVVVPMRRQIVLNQVEPNGLGITGPQPLPGHKNIMTGFAFVNSSTEAVFMDIVKAQQLLGSLGAPIGGPEPVGMFFSGPALPGHGFKFHRPKLVEAHHCSMARGLFVEPQNTVFFDS